MSYTKSNPKKILVLRNDRIGDLVLSLNALTMLRRLYPKARIDMVVSPENKQLVEANKSITKIYVLKYGPRKIKDFLSYLSLAKKLRKEGYDLGVELRGSFFNTIILLFLGNVKFRIGLYRNWFAKLFLNYGHYKDYNVHNTKCTVDLINIGLGANFKSVWPEIKTAPEDKKDVNKFFKNNKISKSITFCIDANNDIKQWPLDKFDEVIKYINKKYPEYKIILLGIDKVKMDYLMQKNPKCISLFKPNLRTIFLVFKRNKLVVGPDGGTMHLAWVTRTNTITLVPDAFKPYIGSNNPLGKNSIMIFKNFRYISTREVKELIDKILKN